jgi:hypothetical protein
VIIESNGYVSIKLHGLLAVDIAGKEYLVEFRSLFVARVFW